MSIENALPADQSLDTALRDFDSITQLVDEFKETRPDILDVSEEFKSFDRLRIVTSLAFTFCHELGVLEHDSSSGIPCQAMYRSLCFAFQIASVAGPTHNLTIPFGDYMDELKDCAAGPKLQIDANTYLSTRPHIDALIGYYSPELDPSSDNRYGAVVEIGCAIGFMLCERGMSEAYLKETNFDVW